MQVHALEKKELISATDALRRKNYLCPECFSPVRVRGGNRKSTHFFHLKKNRLCRQSQKGIIHLKLQERIQSFFEKAELEKTFSSIGRIADVFCPVSKIVYEVQYSPMSPDEAKSRIVDYDSLGYTVIWILHDHTFNKRRKSPLELFLRPFPFYYSNVDESGEGIIYDQLDGHKMQTPVNLKARRPLPSFQWPNELRNRARSWPFYQEGDLLDLALRGKLPHRKKKSLTTSIKEFYLGLLHIALESSS